MSSITMVLVWLAISIAVILYTILKLKLNPTIGLIIGSLVMGLGTGLGVAETTKNIGSGFGGLLGSIGLPIGFGVILGQLLSDSGGARVIAETLVRRTSEKYSLYAMGLAAFLLSVPVFFDITFIILIPLAIEVSKTLKKPLPYAAGAVAICGLAAHTLVPPTPNPLAAASILNFDLGIMMLVGGFLCLIFCILTMKIYFTLLDRGFWNPEKDETGALVISEPAPLPAGAPSFGMAMIPLVLPVICIVLSTVTTMLGIPKNPVIMFFSDRNVAMLLGALSAYVISRKALGSKGMDIAAGKAMEASGVVLLVTGAGGSFGAVISATGFAKAVQEALTGVAASNQLVILTGFGIAVLFRVALGSGTVASITAMTIMASVAATVTVHPVFIALACLAGGMSIGHVNDSAFWVVSNMSGYTIRGGLKSYTLGGAMISAMTITTSLVASFFF